MISNLKVSSQNNEEFMRFPWKFTRSHNKVLCKCHNIPNGWLVEFNYLCRSFFRWLFILTVPVLLIPLIILSIDAGGSVICGTAPGCAPSFSPITILPGVFTRLLLLFKIYCPFKKMFCFRLLDSILENEWKEMFGYLTRQKFVKWKR